MIGGRRFAFSLPVPCLWLLAMVIMVALTGCRYPRDIEGSMERIIDGVIRVGVSENPPWVIETQSGPAGLEVELVQALADELDATIEWHWGSESRLLLALEQHQLDLVISGLTENARVSQLTAPTNAYYHSDYRIGAPQGMTLPDTLEGQEVSLPAVNHIARALKKEGARVHLSTSPMTDHELVVGPTWWLIAHGYAMGHDNLASDAHIMALPKGENAWMMAVQRHLDGISNLEQRLVAWEADQ